MNETKTEYVNGRAVITQKRFCGLDKQGKKQFLTQSVVLGREELQAIVTMFPDHVGPEF